MSRILSDKEKLILTYFYRMPKDAVGQRQRRNGRGKGNGSSSSVDAQPSSSFDKLNRATPDKIFFKYWDSTPEHLDASSNLNAWKIKFLLSTTTPDPGLWTKFTNRMVSRTGSWFDLLPEFGLFHTALIVGPHKIEWIDSSLCVPRPVQTTNAVLLIDIGIIQGSMHYKWIREKMAERIEWWNLNMNYSHRATSADWEETKMGNCQQFVSDIIKHLNLDKQFRKQLKHVKPVLNRIVRNGDAIMELAISRPFFDMFPLTQADIEEGNSSRRDMRRKELLTMREIGAEEGQLSPDSAMPNDSSLQSQIVHSQKYTIGLTLQFSSHAQLDHYVATLLLLDPYVLQKEYDEIQILKAFDRAFWLQKKKHEFLQSTDPQHEVPPFCVESHEESCPFQQPDLTHSIMDMPEASFTETIQEFKQELREGGGASAGEETPR